MITFIFAVICFIIIAFLNQNNIEKYHNQLKYAKLLDKEKKDLIQNKNYRNLIIGVLFIIIGIVFINYPKPTKVSSPKIEDSSFVAIDTELSNVDTTAIIVPNKPLSPQEQFLQDNGFKTDAGFTDSQFKEFKLAINSGLFKKESFCDVYKKGLNLEGNELKKYLNKFRKIGYFETILFMYGPKVCDITSSTQESISSTSYTNTDESANPCIISEDFIKKDLQNPSTADFSMFDCSADKNTDGTYTVLRKVSAKNSYGIKKEFIYKVKLGFKSGNWTDMSNWTLINIQSQEYR